MSTIGWFFILMAGLVLRAVYKGRATELPQDLADLFLAALEGDFVTFKEVANRTGDDLEAPKVETVPNTDVDIDESSNVSTSLGLTTLAEMKRLAALANNRYVFGGTFRNGGGGDCSGLVWRALVNEGIYKGARFTTSTFGRASRSFAHVVSSPQAGDIVVWVRPGINKGHMGIAISPTQLYSAVSTKRGVRTAPMSWFTGTRTVYRIGKA